MSTAADVVRNAWRSGNTDSGFVATSVERSASQWVRTVTRLVSRDAPSAHSTSAKSES